MAFLSTFVGVGKHIDPEISDLVGCTRDAMALHALFAVAMLQFALGVSTLLLVVPIPLAAAHQAVAVLLLTAAIFFRHTLRRPRLDADASTAI